MLHLLMAFSLYFVVFNAYVALISVGMCPVEMLAELVLVWERTQTHLVWVCRVVEWTWKGISLFGVLGTHVSLQTILPLAAEVTTWLLTLKWLLGLMHRVEVAL